MPTKSNVARAKRLERYLVEFPRLVRDFGRKEGESEDAIHDDWACCPERGG